MSVFTVRHVSTYRYARPVRFGPHRLMMRPRSISGSMVSGAALVAASMLGAAATSTPATTPAIEILTRSGATILTRAGATVVARG
jgi:hypothetical protein